MSCINTKIKEAMENKDIVRVMNKASESFRSQLDHDDIYTCQINALWKSFLNFKPNKNTKFTTYLFKGVFIECLKELKFKKKSSRCNRKLHGNIPSKSNPTFMVDMLDEVSSSEDRDLLMDKYSNLTIQEMADKREYSRETVRKKLKKIYQNIQDKFE